MFYRLAPFFQFLPISLFSTYAFALGLPSNERWLEAFMLSALVGVLQLVVLAFVKRPMSRLVLAINSYLIVGGLAAFFQQWWVLDLYNQGQELSIFIFIFTVGIITTFASQHGFIALEKGNKKQIRFASYLLLTASVVAAIIAFIFQGNTTYSAVLPIISLALIQRILLFRLRKSLEATNDLSPETLVS